MPPMGQYMPGYAPGMPQMGVPPNAQMRYQIPGDPSKMLSGARHKKEVKRRTKTGCLTCRKRRIKVSRKLGGWWVRRGGLFHASSRLACNNTPKLPNTHLRLHTTPLFIFLTLRAQHRPFIWG